MAAKSSAKSTQSPPASPQGYPVINLTLATMRDDGGETDNYRVFEGGGQVQVKSKKGETVVKNTITGGNGTIYIAKEKSTGHDAWVLLPRAAYDKLTGGKK
jgi:hypothetical protein